MKKTSKNLDPLLFSPTISGDARRLPVAGQRPLKSDYFLVIAMFAGILTTMFLQWKNAQRLQTEKLKRDLIIAVGLAGLLIFLIAVGLTAGRSGTGEEASSMMRGVRYLGSAIRLGFWFFTNKLLLNDYRTYVMRHGDDSFDSFDPPTILTVIGLVVLEIGVVLALALGVKLG